MDDIIKEEKDLVLLLGSFLVYKQTDYLYELIKYVESYNSLDILNIVSLVKEHLPATLIKWFADFVANVSDESALNAILSLPIDLELIGIATSLIEPEVISSFIQFWGEV